MILQRFTRVIILTSFTIILYVPFNFQLICSRFSSVTSFRVLSLIISHLHHVFLLLVSLLFIRIVLILILILILIQIQIHHLLKERVRNHLHRLHQKENQRMQMELLPPRRKRLPLKMINLVPSAFLPMDCPCYLNWDVLFQPLFLYWLMFYVYSPNNV